MKLNLFAALSIGLALAGNLAGCSTDSVTGKITLTPTAQAIATEASALGWPLACAYAKGRAAKIKTPTAVQSAAIATITATCAGAAPTDLASAQTILAQAAATFTGSLAQ